MFSNLLDQTLQHYKISGRRLAEVAGVDKNHVSAIRRGTSEVGSGTLLKLLDAMESLAPGSKLYFCLLLAGKSPNRNNLEQVLDSALLIESMNNRQLMSLMKAIAEHFTSDMSESDVTEKIAV